MHLVNFLFYLEARETLRNSWKPCAICNDLKKSEFFYIMTGFQFSSDFSLTILIYRSQHTRMESITFHESVMARNQIFLPKTKNPGSSRSSHT